MKLKTCLILGFASLLWVGPATAQKKGRAVLTIPEVASKDIICFALYTVHDKTLKLTAQLYPIPDDATKEVRLEIEKDGKWVEVAKTTAIEQGWTAPFRVENWDDSQAYKYRVLHGSEATYEGIVRKNPTDKEEILVAGYTGNSIHPGHGGDISRQDLIDNVKKADVDVLFFSGDQVYDHHKHYAA